MLALLALLSNAASAWVPADTHATNAAGVVTITGQPSTAIHTHGGAPATLSDARFEVKNLGAQPVSVTVAKIVFLRGRSCEAPPTDRAAEPTFGGLFVSDGTLQESVKQLIVAPAATVVVDVGFTGVEAYYSHCDRFAFEVAFDVGGERLTAIAETNVTRVDPLRKP